MKLGKWMHKARETSWAGRCFSIGIKRSRDSWEKSGCKGQWEGKPWGRPSKSWENVLVWGSLPVNKLREWSTVDHSHWYQIFRHWFSGINFDRFINCYCYGFHFTKLGRPRSAHVPDLGSSADCGKSLWQPCVRLGCPQVKSEDTPSGEHQNFLRVWATN